MVAVTAERVAAEINERIRKLQWSKAEVVRRTGISFKTIDNLMERGALPSRIDKRRELAVGLGLDREAIPRMLAGECIENVTDGAWSPDEEDDADSDPVLTELRRLTDRVAGLEQLLREASSPEGD